jgi:dTDP-4-amino-4,6-dideoxygalactose transaminase
MGVNSRLDPIQAAVLRVNLGYLNEWNSARREVALHYLDCMNDSGSKVRPLIATADESVWHHFVVQSENRDSLRDIASAEGIGTDVHYPRTAADEIASILGLSAPQLPRSSELAATVLSLPLNPWLPESAVERVGDFLRGR